MNGQTQVVRQRRVGHHHLGGKQNTHAQAAVALHEVVRKIAQHRGVIHRHRGVEVAAFHITACGAAGHESALAVIGGHTAERQVFERIDGHRRNGLPAFHQARRFAALLAKPLKRQVVFKLMGEDAQREGIEVVIDNRWTRDEFKHLRNDERRG